MFTGYRIQVTADELAGRAGTVVTDWRFDGPLQVPRECVWVVLDGGDNPLPFRPDEIERAACRVPVCEREAQHAA